MLKEPDFDGLPHRREAELATRFAVEKEHLFDISGNSIKRGRCGCITHRIQ